MPIYITPSQVLLKEGIIAMVELYCKLIIIKRRTFDQVPDILKNDVESRLKELGYDVNGDNTN